MNMVDPSGHLTLTCTYNGSGCSGDCSCGSGASGNTSGNSGNSDSSGNNNLAEDWRQVAQAAESFGREIGRWGNDIGNFFGGMFKHNNSNQLLTLMLMQTANFNISGYNGLGAMLSYGNGAESNIGQSIVTSGPFIRAGETIGASQLNSVLTGYDFRGNEFSGLERLGQGVIALTNVPMSPGKMGSNSIVRSEHAMLRGLQGRNVGTVVNDVQKARMADVLVQGDGRFVVRGANGREHIITQAGEHITTINNRSNASRLNRDRSPASQEQFNLLKGYVQ